MQNKNLEDRMRESLKDYQSSLDKNAMYHDFEKIYGERSKNKFAFVFLFFGLIIIGAGLYVSHHKINSFERFSGMKSDEITAVNEKLLSERDNGYLETETKVEDQKNQKNSSGNLKNLVKIEHKDDPIARKEETIASKISTSNKMVSKEELDTSTTSIELIYSGELQRSDLKPNAFNIFNAAPKRKKHATTVLPVISDTLFAQHLVMPNIELGLRRNQFMDDIENSYYKPDLHRASFRFSVGFLSTNDIKTPSFIAHQTLDHIFLNFSIQKSMNKNFSLEPTISYSKYNINQVGTVNLPLQYDTIDSDIFRGIISEYSSIFENDSTQFDQVSYHIMHDLYTLDLGINLIHQLYLGKNWFLETTLGPKLSWNIKSKGSWSNQSKTTIIEDYGITDSKNLVLILNGKIGVQKFYDNARALSFGIATQRDLSDRRKKNNSLDKLFGVGFYLGLTAGL